MSNDLGLTIDGLDVYAVGLPASRSFGVSGGTVAVAGHRSIRVLVPVGVVRELAVDLFQGTGA